MEKYLKDLGIDKFKHSGYFDDCIYYRNSTTNKCWCKEDDILEEISISFYESIKEREDTY